MSKRDDPEWTVLGDWTRELLDSYREQIESRNLMLQLELDPHFVVARSPARAIAFEGLLRMIFGTIPDAAEIYICCQRSSTPVSRLGEGDWIARWQVLLDHDAAAFQSKISDRLEASFSEVGWELELNPIAKKQELHARIRCREPLSVR